MTWPCVFCAIAQNDARADSVWENEDWLAFWDRRPRAKTHVLVIPRWHIVTIGELADSERSSFVDAIASCAEALSLGDYRVQINAGRSQHVKHLHAHLLSP